MLLRQIEVFFAVYTSGSITNAAKALNVSQPSVSKVLSHAEQQLGYRLFERSKGRLIPTPEGHTLIKPVADVYRDLDKLRRAAKRLGDATAGRVRVASTPALGAELLPLAVAAFHEQHPGIVFEIETLHFDELASAILDSRVDIGLAFDPAPVPGIEHRRLGTGQFVALAPAGSDFVAGATVTTKELARHPFIALNSRGPLGQLLSAYITSAGAELNIVAWTETYHVAKALVAGRVGMAVVDQITALSTPVDGVTILRLKPALKFTVCALHATSAALSMPAKHFIREVKTTLTRYLGPAAAL